MTNHNNPPMTTEHVACEICMKEVPISEATVPEATDYVVHFCGLDCYQKWKSQEAQRVEPAGAVDATGAASA